MIKIVKNIGQCSSLKGKGKYILSVNDKRAGDVYANIALKPIIGYIKSFRKGTFQ